MYRHPHIRGFARFIGSLIRLAILALLMVVGWNIGTTMGGENSVPAVLGLIIPVIAFLLFVSIRDTRVR